MGRELALGGGRPVVAAGQHVRWPVIRSEDRAAVLAVLDRGVLSGPFAPEVRSLEASFAAFIGARHCLATNSGTAALHIALAAAGVGPGDEVITSAYSFVATAMAVLHQSAIPVFVDIEPGSCGIDPRLIEAAITPRTRAIVPVHIHGTPCDIEPIREIAKRRGLTLIEDAAQAHGAESGGKKVGSFGAMGCFSTQSSKSLSCGEGGLFVTDDDELCRRANRTRMFGEEMLPSDEASYRLDHALDGTRAYDSVTMGWMYRTNEMSAALARSQLARLEESNAFARNNAELLARRLRELPGVTPVSPPPGRTSCWHKFRVRLDGTRVGVDAPATVIRDAVLRALRAEGVEAVLWQTQPVPGQTLFREKVGTGRGHPWSLGAPVDYDLARYPETVRLLDSSIVLFSQTYPIAPQPASLCEAYAEAFAKVWERLGEVVCSDQAA
jgi:perosamine synthetase